MYTVYMHRDERDSLYRGILLVMCIAIAVTYLLSLVVPDTAWGSQEGKGAAAQPVPTIVGVAAGPAGSAAARGAQKK